MIVFYSDTHKQHNPPFEGYTDKGNILALEIPERAEIVLKELRETEWAEILPPIDFGLEPILEVHCSHYLNYLRSAFESWSQYSQVPDMAFFPATFGIDYEKVQSGDVSEEAGFFLLDTTVAITQKTFPAALESVNCALSGAKAMKPGHPVFALCRPPGHHAGREICGGYCYLNNAAIAAQWLSKSGKVVILDVDYHAGNGTQAIFYNRADVFMVSLHANPAREYPRYAGYAHEIGVSSGEGFHRNFPLPAGITDAEYLLVLDEALTLIDDFSPDNLVISVGMDIYKEDPLGDFKITRQGIYEIGQRIAGLNLPSLIVMEGGYHIPSIGVNMVSFLNPFESRR